MNRTTSAAEGRVSLVGSLAGRVGPVGLLCLTAGLVLLLATSGTSAAVATTFTVDSSADGADATIDGVCADGAGACTLRAAIQESNASLGDKDTIAFDISAAPLSIAPATELPDVTDPVVIDGTTQPGWADDPIVELRGPGLLWGLRVTAGDTTIRGLVINSFNNEVVLETNGDNIVAGNFIGTDVTGMQDGGWLGHNGTQLIVASGDTNTIGGTTPGDRNVIAGVAPGHLEVRSSDNTIQGNFIGTNAAGNAAVGPSNAGIAIGHLGARNLVGGTGPGTGNLISGNGVGIGIGGPETIVQGNLIGTDVSGAERIPNGTGVEVSALATRIARNVISGNTATGILVQSDDAIIQGNLIGPDISGTKTPGSTNAPGNGSHGIDVHVGAGNLIGNLIGGTDPGARNVISGNGDFGIALGFEASRNRIKGNFIGTDDTGTQPLGNHLHGVCVCPIAGGIATDNVIGGTEAGAGNVIAYNRGSGVAIGSHPDFPGHNSILRNSIHSNGILGIDLVGLVELPDPNDPGDADEGANDLQNYPVLDWTSAGNQTTVTGTLNSEPNKTYRIEFFHNRECNRFPSEFFTGGPFGQGETFLGAIDVSTDGNGDAVIPAVTYPKGTGVTEVITATATNSNNATSEFSECRADLEITKADDPDPVQNDQTLTYTIEVVNRGPAPALRVVVEDQLPPESAFTLDSISPSQGNCSLFGTFARCQLGLMPRYGEARITITGTVTGSPPQTITNTASVFSELTDPDPDDNSATAETQVVEQPATGTIVVTKQTLPAGSSQAFAFTASYSTSGFSLTDGQSNTSAPLAPGSYSVSENPVQGWDTTASCDDGSLPNAIDLSADETVTCTFTNTKRGTVSVRKTVSGAPFSGSQSFTFQLRQGASPTSAGTILESQNASAANSGVITFATTLLPGATYALCELVLPGWTTTLGPPVYVPFNPGGDNSTVCTDFTVEPGATKSFSIDNKPPPGGLGRTIGFWKNWASCTKGNQKPVLDQTLAKAEPSGVTIGILTLHGSASNPSVAPDCLKAVRLLDKSTIDSGKKSASDPAFNMAAQLFAAKLNVVAGAGSCPAAVSAINSGQTLLTTIRFNGITHDRLSAAQSSQANSLAGTLDRYNNNLLC